MKRGRGGKRGRWRAVWAWSWVLTLPLTLAWISWARSTWLRYEDFALRHDSYPIQFSLLEVGREEALHLLRRAWLTLVPDGGRGRAVHDDLRTISLFVPEQSLAELDAELPDSGFEFVDAGLWDGQRLLEAELRYRGDYAVHWAWPKKSLRVKTDRDTLFEGMRTFNLLAPKFPEQLNNYLGYRLAQRLGLLTPRSELVHVAVNGHLRGVHVLVEQPDEGTLRSNGRMPGDLYAGELVADDLWHGVSGTVFDHPGLWEKMSVDNHYPELHREPLRRLFGLLNAFPDESSQEELSRMVDMQAFGRFAALEILGQTMHFDHTHNWRLFWDKNRGHFEPLVWDSTAWAPHFRPSETRSVALDVEVSRMHIALHRNGDFLRARHAAIAEFFRSGEALDFIHEVDETIAKLLEALRVDPDRRPTSMAEIRAEVGAMRDSIARTFAIVERVYLVPSGGVRYAQLSGGGAGGIALEVSGRAPVQRLVIDFERPVVGPVAARVAALRDGREVLVDLTGATGSSGHQVTVDLGLLPRPHSILKSGALPLKNRRFVYEPATYELRLAGLAADNAVVQVRADRGGTALETCAPAAAIALEPLEGLFAFAVERPAFEPVQWSGEIEVEGLLEIDRDLVIAAGSTVRMAPGASLVLTGRLIAQGTREAPIRFEPGGAEPWGVLALQGPAASGSVLRHCDLSGGSGLKDGLREYSAFFSVHDAEGVLVDRCRFSDSQVVDDMVHAVYAEITFVECLFERSLFDAMDLDVCQGSIERCVFRDSGNDAIDLMTSRVLVMDTALVGSEDKGISVGEGSLLLAVNNRFERNAIGTQVKDSSLAEIWNSDFTDNGMAIDAYKKNWRYDGGGRVVVHNSHLAGNQRSVQADKHSAIELFDTYCDAAIDEKRVTLDATVDSLEPRRARSRGMPELLAEVGELRGLATRARNRIDTTARGVKEVPPVP